MNTHEIVIGATGHSVTFPITDSDGVAKVPSNLSAASYEAVSRDLPGSSINAAAVYDEGANVAMLDGCGGLIALATLGARPSATFVGRLRWEDDDGTHYGTEVALHFVRAPGVTEDLVPAPLFIPASRLTLHRGYNFATAPLTKRNNFASAQVLAYPPAVIIRATGAVTENRRLCELAPEVFYEEGGGGTPFPNTSVRGDEKHGFRVQMGAICTDFANLGDDAFISVGFGSWDYSLPPSVPANGGQGDAGFFEVRKKLRSPMDWYCAGRPGIGSTADAPEYYESPVVTLPNLAFLVKGHTSDYYLQGGEMVEVQLDPFTYRARAWVRGILIYDSGTNQNRYPSGFADVSSGYPAPVIRLALFSGTQAAAKGEMVAMWSGLIVEDYGVDQYSADV